MDSSKSDAEEIVFLVPTCPPGLVAYVVSGAALTIASSATVSCSAALTAARLAEAVYSFLYVKVFSSLFPFPSAVTLTVTVLSAIFPLPIVTCALPVNSFTGPSSTQ